MRTFTLALSLAALSASSAFGANCLATSSTCPVVKLVRAAANEPLRSHPAYPGRAAILKATVVPTGATISYDWDFGDGTPHATGTVTDIYAIEASHNYALPGAFTAILTLTNGTTSETFSANYSISVTSKVLANEVAIAIEDGLWYLHKTLQRSVVSSVPYGTWMNCGFPTCAFYGGIDAQNIQAFETGGFLENGDPNDPYTETVSRSMKAVLEKLTSTAISNTKTIYVNGTLGSITLNPDVNGNGVGVYPSGGNEMYQGGMYMDALVASKTPSKIVDFGPLADGIRTYGDAVQDQVDYHVNCQDVGDPGGFFGVRNGGGWRYSCNSDADNSVNQWAAIGLIAAEDEWGKTAPAAAKQANAEGWLLQSRDTASGVFGYDTPSPIWGPYATTPSGMVQLVWSHIGRGDTRWTMAESYLRDNFGNGGGSSNNLKAYYYGLFSFTKAMLLHNTGAGIAPISLLQSTTPGVNPIDWYGAERDMSQPESVNNTNGVARTLVNEQSAAGYWTVTPEQTSEQDAFDTSWAVIMLRRTVFQLLPVSCFTATPALVANGGPVQFDAKCSFHQDTSKQIVKYEWDFSGNNQAYVLGTPQMRRNMSGAVGTNIAVRLRITDNSVPALSAEFTGFIRIASPPTPPTSNPAGPYSFCTNTRANGTLIYTPFMLDGSRSSNPDDGKFEPLPIGNPPSALVLYEWFLNPAAPNTVSFSGGPAASQVRVDGAPFNFQTRAGQSFNVALRVTNNDHLSFPSAALAAGLSNTALASVFVRPATDPECTHCVADLRSNAKGAAPGRPGNVQLYWTDKDNASFPIDHYNIYRSTSPTFAPFTQIAGANANAAAVKVRRLQVPMPPTTTLFFQDNNVVAGTTYYYRVTPATLNDSETCQSNLTLQVSVPIIR